MKNPEWADVYVTVFWTSQYLALPALEEKGGLAFNRVQTKRHNALKQKPADDF